MRARFGLARTLWDLGKKEEALTHYWEMLRLNPSDNQGVRYLLINCLLGEGLDGEAEKLLRQYDEDCFANWAYSWTLLVFQQEGSSEKAKDHLKKAMVLNVHVPAFLTGRKRMPKALPSHYGMGDLNEAAVYAWEAKDAWKQTKGAIVWLKEMTESGKELSQSKKKEAVDKPKTKVVSDNVIDIDSARKR